MPAVHRLTQDARYQAVGLAPGIGTTEVPRRRRSGAVGHRNPGEPAGWRVQRERSPSLVGALGVPPSPYPLCFPLGKWADIGNGDGRTAVRPYEFGIETGGKDRTTSK